MVQSQTGAFGHAEQSVVGHSGLDAGGAENELVQISSKDEPPVSVMPLSMISEESSGGVSCKTFLITFIISLSSESMALTTSLVVISAVLGKPVRKSRPLIL